jgi:hypothetical protein
MLLKLINSLFSKQQHTFLLLCFLLIFRFIFETEKLPDYEAYFEIYSNPALYREWNLIFTTFIEGFKFLFPYEIFRFTIFIFGTILYLKLSLIQTWKELVPLFLLSCIILLEFYMIRLRAGMCITIFYFFYFCFMRQLKIISLPFALTSFCLHPATFLTLSLVYWPKILNITLNKAFIFFNICLWVCALLIVDFVSVERGEHLYSVINPYRFFVLMFIPTLFFLIISKFDLGKILNKTHTEFIGLLSLNIALIGLYLAGVFETSGEAIIRVYSIVAGPALLFSIILNNDKCSTSYKILAFSTLSINSLFFIRTVYL